MSCCTRSAARPRGAALSDPLGRELQAGFALLEDGGTAVVEVAEASGLRLVAEAERDAEAARRRHRRADRGRGRRRREVVLVASAAVGDDRRRRGRDRGDRGGGRPGGASSSCLCDVRTPFERAAGRSRPQKGADAETIRALAKRARASSRRRSRATRAASPMTGAAGGLAGGLWARYGAGSSRAPRSCSTRWTSTSACARPAPWSSARAGWTTRRCRARSPARSRPRPARAGVP